MRSSLTRALQEYGKLPALIESENVSLRQKVCATLSICISATDAKLS